MALALKYRPKYWTDIVGQDTVVSILQRQVATKSWKNAYLFCGAHGCGKTSTARILANEVNGGEGAPIELDCASHNGVDTIRSLIVDAQQSSIDCEYKVYILDECVSGDTEVLTDSGWKRFDTLDKTEKIAQYTSDGNVEFVTPTEYIETDYTGDMYNIKIGNKASFMMSPNHVQPLLYVKSNKIKEKYIKDIKFSQTNKFIRSGSGVGVLQHLSVEDRLAICLQADGTVQQQYDTYNYWTIQLKKDRKKDRLLSILSEYSNEYKEIKSYRDGYIRYAIKTNPNITKKLSTHFDLTKMSSEYAKEFISELMEWDGYVAYNKYHYYSSIIKENVDFCQSVGILGGFASRVAIEQDNRSEKFNNVYRIYLTETYSNCNNAHVTKETLHFEGKIYCVKVPSHMIIIRKDGYELVTGNCHNLSRPAWDASLKLIEEPPLNSIFIFCTTNPDKIPETILSRVQRFDFLRVSKDVIADRLEFILNEEFTFNSNKYNPELPLPYSRKALERIAVLADGHIRDAVQYLDKCLDVSDEITMEVVESVLGLVKYDVIMNLLNALYAKDLRGGLEQLTTLKTHNTNMMQVYDAITDVAIDTAIFAQFNDISFTSIPSEYKNQLSTDIELTKLVVNRLVNFRHYLLPNNVETFLKTLFIEICG